MSRVRDVVFNEVSPIGNGDPCNFNLRQTMGLFHHTPFMLL